MQEQKQLRRAMLRIPCEGRERSIGPATDGQLQLLSGHPTYSLEGVAAQRDQSKLVAEDAAFAHQSALHEEPRQRAFDAAR